MANILGLITVNGKQVIEVDGDPSLSGGVPAEIGSLALYSTGTQGFNYIKTGAADTAWDAVATTANGGVGVGNYLRLPIYDTNATGYHVDDTVAQNGFDISVAIVPQGSRSTNLTYNIPNPGNAVSSVDFVLTEGAQTINGDKTFGNNVIISGDLTVNGTLTYLNSTNTNITDKLITLNKGGAAASAGGSGIEFEENAAITGYIKQAPGRDGYLIKSSNAFELDFNLSNLTADRAQRLADTAGTFVMRPNATPGVAGQVAFWQDANNLVSEANLFWDSANDRLGIGTNAPSTNLHVVGGARISALGLGVVHADANGNLSSSAVDLTSEVTGVLPIANGGTNSSTALNNNRMMVSSGGAIVEHSALTQGSVFFADTNGLPGQNNAKFFWDNTNYSLGLGTATPDNGSGGTGAPTIHMKGDGASWLILEGYGGGGVIQSRHAQGTEASPTATQSGNGMLFIGARGYGATGFSAGGKVAMEYWAAENWSDTAQGTQIMFSTTANGTTSRLRRFSIHNDGRIGIHSPSNQNNILGIYAASALTPYNITLPSAQGAANTFMRNDGSGVLSWNKVDLTTDVSGILPVANGGTNSSATLNNNRIMVSSGSAIVEHSALTTGSVLFANANGLPGQNNANFFWDNTNTRLGLGTATPSRLLDVNGSSLFAGAIKYADAGAVNANWEMMQAQVSTTNNTVTTIATVAIPTDKSVMIVARVVGRRTSGSGSAGDAATYIRTAHFKNIAGTVTRKSLQTDFTSEDVNQWDSTISVSGTNAIITVQGAATTNIDWTVTYEVIVL